MKANIQLMRKSEKICVRPDKSKNIYKVNPYEYEQILKNKITEFNRIDHNNTPH